MIVSKESIERSENSDEFHRRMRLAMVESFHKYGPLKSAYPHKVNAIANLKARLAKYEETGNLDYLIDCANFAMIEFMHPAHENYNDKHTDNTDGRYWHSGGPSTVKRNDGTRETRSQP